MKRVAWALGAATILLAAAMPVSAVSPIDTTTTLTAPDGAIVLDAPCFDAYVSPIPGAGHVRFDFAPPTGDLRQIDPLYIWIGEGHSQVCYTLDLVGTWTVNAQYEGDLGWESSTSAPATVEVARRPTTTTAGADLHQVSTKPLRVSVAVTGSRETPDGGGITLFETTGGANTEIGIQPIGDVPGSGIQGTTFVLPARDPGTYAFRAEYSGTDRFLPSSADFDADVAQGLIPGSASINGGAAITTSPIVNVSMPATGAIAVALSNSGSIWKVFYPPVASTSWALDDPAYGGSAEEGTKHVLVRFQDVWFNWFDPVDLEIAYDTSPPNGTVRIDGGATATNSRAVTLNIPATDAGTKVTKVKVSNDGETWVARAFDPALGWTLRAGDGGKRVLVRWRDRAGHWSGVKADRIVLDHGAPTMRDISWSWAKDVPRSGHRRISLRWAGSDALSGVSAYRIQRSVDGKHFVNLDRIGLTTASLVVANGHTYRFRVRAIDGAGNRSRWLTTASIKARK